jgi:hypothetical protein
MDLAPGGCLEYHAKQYTFFPTYEMNVEFLDAINYAGDGVDNEIDGLLVGLRFFKSKKEEIKGDKEQPPHADTRANKRILDWRMEYLLFSMYCRVNMTQKQLTPSLA